jgi:hypothetical protein
MNPTDFAWEALCNTMRLYAETSLVFKRLLLVDQEEAIANHDRALDAKLEAFHRLYDVTKKLPKFDYFAHADTALLIALRNALHHRDHTLFIGWNAMLCGNGGIGKKAGAEYLLTGYEVLTDGTSRYYLPLHDFYARLGHSSIKHPDAMKAQWDTELAFAAMAKRAADEGYPGDQVYVDIIPIFISAIRRVAGWLRESGITPQRFDGLTYVDHFNGLAPLELTTPTFMPLRIPVYLYDGSAEV